MAAPYVNHTTYTAFKLATLGNRYDLDNFPTSQPYQCWDYVDLLYEQSDVGQYLSTGGTGNVKGCWQVASARASNGSGHFRTVYGKTNIKKGDIVVFNQYSGWYGSTGHIGFADQNYNGTEYIRLLSQNFYGYHYVTVQQAYLGSAFLGIFRFIPWESPTPTPTPTPTLLIPEKEGFPWAVAWKHWKNFKKPK